MRGALVVSIGLVLVVATVQAGEKVDSHGRPLRRIRIHGRSTPPGAAVHPSVGEQVLGCRVCGEEILKTGTELFNITSPGATATLTSHVLGHYVQVHRLANAHGIVFEIATSRSATGVAVTGLSVRGDSWFPGFSWQVVQCHRCHAHIGWHFSAPAQRDFYGLILETLVDGRDVESTLVKRRIVLP